MTGTENEKFYAVKNIIDEKIQRGRLYYKIDWADNSETGESFDPTWVRLLLSRLSFGPPAGRATTIH